MLFNSYTFILGFLPLTLLAFFLTAKHLGSRPALAVLTFASLLFYAWWNPPYVALIVLSMLINYAIGTHLSDMYGVNDKASKSYWVATGGVIANLAVLGYYKYANFFVATLGQAVGARYHLETIILPLGISFFTFEQVGYVVDAYKGKARHYTFLEYVFFVTFFPHLIAGPIIAHHELLSQVEKGRSYRFDAQAFATGLTLFIIGLFKKVVFADYLATVASPMFDAAFRGVTPTAFAAWLGTVAYALQLYFDFSGYSDMGLGLARMLGFKLPLNFDSPYKAANIIDFWRRWHITLSRFLRDYLYIALGGNRSGKARRHINLMLTMFLGGLWHGAGWSFAMWGALHGFYLMVNHGFRSLRKNSSKPDPWIVREASTTLTFVAVLVGWVFFRAADWNIGASILQSMAGFHGLGLQAWSADKLAVAACVALYLVARVAPNSQELLARHDPTLPIITTSWRWQWQWSPLWAVLTAALACISLLGMTHVTEFLYFQF